MSATDTCVHKRIKLTTTLDVPSLSNWLREEKPFLKTIGASIRRSAESVLDSQEDLSSSDISAASFMLDNMENVRPTSTLVELRHRAMERLKMAQRVSDLEVEIQHWSWKYDQHDEAMIRMECEHNKALRQHDEAMTRMERDQNEALRRHEEAMTRVESEHSKALRQHEEDKTRHDASMQKYDHAIERCNDIISKLNEEKAQRELLEIEQNKERTHDQKELLRMKIVLDKQLTRNDQLEEALQDLRRKVHKLKRNKMYIDIKILLSLVSPLPEGYGNLESVISLRRNLQAHTSLVFDLAETMTEVQEESEYEHIQPAVPFLQEGLRLYLQIQMKRSYATYVMAVQDNRWHQVHEFRGSM